MEWWNRLTAENYPQYLLKQAEDMTAPGANTRQLLDKTLREKGLALSDSEWTRMMGAFGQSDSNDSNGGTLSITEIAAILFAASDPEKQDITPSSRQTFQQSLSQDDTDLLAYARQKNQETFGRRPTSELSRMNVLNAVCDGGANAAKGVIDGSGIALGITLVAPLVGGSALVAPTLGTLGVLGTGYAGYQTHQSVKNYQQATEKEDAAGRLEAIRDGVENGSFAVLGVAGAGAAIKSAKPSPSGKAPTPEPTAATKPTEPTTSAAPAETPPLAVEPPAATAGGSTTGSGTTIATTGGSTTASGTTAATARGSTTASGTTAATARGSTTASGTTAATAGGSTASPLTWTQKRLNVKIKRQETRLEALKDQQKQLSTNRKLNGEREDLRDEVTRLKEAIASLKQDRKALRVPEQKASHNAQIKAKKQELKSAQTQLDQLDVTLKGYKPNLTLKHLNKKVQAAEKKLGKLQQKREQVERPLSPRQKGAVSLGSVGIGAGLSAVQRKELSWESLLPLASAQAAESGAPTTEGLKPKPKYDFYPERDRNPATGGEKKGAPPLAPATPPPKLTPPDQANLPPIVLQSLPKRSAQPKLPPSTPAPESNARPAPKSAAAARDQEPPSAPAVAPKPNTDAASITAMLQRFQAQDAARATPGASARSHAPKPGLPPIELQGRSQGASARSRAPKPGLPPIELQGRSQDASTPRAQKADPASDPQNYPEPDRPVWRRVERDKSQASPRAAALASAPAHRARPASPWDSGQVGWNDRS